MSRIIAAVILMMSAGSCSSWLESSGRGASSRALALRAAKATLDNGGYESLIDQAVGGAFSVAKTRLETLGRPISATQTSQLQAAIRDALTAVYPREVWEEAVTSLYLSNLDRDELRALLAFHRSKLGRKMLLLQARLMAGNEINRQVLEPRQREYAERLGAGLRRVFQDQPPP